MSTLPLAGITGANVVIREDYTEDYQGSNIPASYRLELPDAAQRTAAFDRIRERLAVPLDTRHDIFTAIVEGRHVLLYGPPGTGKTTLADMIPDELFNCAWHRETAVADWTPFETIGGLQLETTPDGRERLAPQPGVITRQVVACLNTIGQREVGGGDVRQGAWLIIDELNRANMDAAFGQFFTALDQDQPEVSLPFFDPPRQRLWVPKRFRIIGTMNTFDRNFLFRFSYALTRRFALIPIDVPANDDEEARGAEREQLWRNLGSAVRERLPSPARPDQELRDRYGDALVRPLYDELVTRIRASQEGGGLGRGLGFAQIAAALRHAVFEVELGLVDPDAAMVALDRGIRSAIVPQLEGLPSGSLDAFAAWWASQPGLKEATRSIDAVRELVRGASLYRTE